MEAAIEAGAYPILMIERFHAFANIRDGGMASMLSRLRSIESDGQMTTLGTERTENAYLRPGFAG